MEFMDEAVERVKNIWEDCAHAPFVEEMGKGTLDKEKFLDYIVQDSIYLRGYVKEFAHALTKATTLKDMQDYYEAMGFVNDSENKTRLDYLKDHGMCDADVDHQKPHRQCADYLAFLEENGSKGEEEIMMAVMPCMMGYHHVFKTLAKQRPEVFDSYYGPLVKDYASQAFKDCCDFWEKKVNLKCNDLSSSRKEELIEIFTQASLHELAFWQMAGGER